MIFLIPKKPLLKKNILKKITIKSEKQTGWKAIRSRPVMSIAKQEELQSTKNLARLTQKSTSLVLARRGITSKLKRARVQWAMQQSYNDNATREQVIKAREILLEEFGSVQKVVDFTEEVLKTYNLNIGPLVQQKKQKEKAKLTRGTGKW